VKPRPQDAVFRNLQWRRHRLWLCENLAPSRARRGRYRGRAERVK